MIGELSYQQKIMSGLRESNFLQKLMGKDFDHILIRQKKEAEISL